MARVRRLAGLGLALVLAGGAGLASAQTVPPGETSIPVPAAKPAGIAGGGTRLFVLDGETGEVLELAPATGEVRNRFTTGISGAKGLAFDGTVLWAGDPGTKRIRGFDAATGAAAREIPLEVPPEKGYRSLEALAWDGSRLWTAIAAGFSSSFNQVDPGSGRIERSLFADCDPRGLAVRDGRLWSLCFNGAGNPPTVDERQLAPAESAVQRSRQLLRRLDGRGPSGLFFDGSFLWTLDAGTRRALRFPPEKGGEPQRPSR